jgi:hypothetical protein
VSTDAREPFAISLQAKLRNTTMIARRSLAPLLAVCGVLGCEFLAPGGGCAGERTASKPIGEPPRTVAELWAAFDPRAEPLETRVVREWSSDGVAYKSVTFHVGRFLDRPARVAAFYASPVNSVPADQPRRLPGLLHLHGGGQRAFLHEVEFYAKRGYACLSLNWGGREMERAEPGDPPTDWGAVDPTQNNVPGYNSLRPGGKTLDAFDSPRNNNWYLLTLAARRGLTFLEQQPEVDPEKLGVYGHSMGGNLTIYVAGCDDRVKAAAPSVGGSGFRQDPWPLLPAYRPGLPDGDPDLFRATLGFESYAPRIRAPLLWLGATNDFHGLMDDTYRTGDLVPHEHVRYAFTPHMNHRFTPEFAVTRPLWFDQWLKGGTAIPRTPRSELSLRESGGEPVLRVQPDDSRRIVDVRVYYSVDPDPRARFWRSANVETSDAGWSAILPLMSTREPLFAFANVTYSIPATASEPHARNAERWSISSRLHTVAPAELAAANVRPKDQAEDVIDDFSHGWRDWYSLSADNPHHWEYSTRKLCDPKWRGREGRQLAISVQSELANELVVVLTENFFRSYRGRQREYIAVVKLPGGAAAVTARLAPADFRTPEGDPLKDWEQIDLLSFRPYFERGTYFVGRRDWPGTQPVFSRLGWEP